MRKIKNIQKIVAVFLLAVFSLAVTPKLTVHKWFANHNDSSKKVADHKTTILGNAGYNCPCDDQVAESNFIGACFLATSPSFQAHLFLNQRTVSLVSVSSLYKELRGPPFKI